MGNLLSKVEGDRLGELEQVIERGKTAFVQVGTALLAIRDERLYRESSETFEAYCQVKWGFTRRRAGQLIQAAEVISEVSAGSENWENNFPSDQSGDSKFPENDAQARALGEAPPGQRAAAWNEAVKTAPTGANGKPKVTAAQVRRVAEKFKSKPDEPAADTSMPPEQPFDAANAKLDQVISDCLSLHKTIFQLMDFDPQTKRARAPYMAAFYQSHLTDHLNQMILVLKSERAARLDERDPKGFLTVRQAETKASVSASMRK